MVFQHLCLTHSLQCPHLCVKYLSYVLCKQSSQYWYFKVYNINILKSFQSTITKYSILFLIPLIYNFVRVLANFEEG